MEVFKIFATMSLVDAMSRPLGTIQTNLKGTEAAAGSLSTRLGRLSVGLAKAAGLATVFLGSLTACTVAAAGFETKMHDLGRAARIESPAELAEMGRAIQDISLQVPVAAGELAEMAAAGAKAKVAAGELAGFAAQAAKVGVAFKVSGSEAAKTLADWQTGLGLTTTQAYALANAVRGLSGQFNASAGDIAQVLGAVGNVGQLAGLAERDIAALAAASLEAGGDAGLTGQALNKLFGTLAGGVGSMGQEAKAAFKMMGLDAAQLARTMKTDARGGIMSVMQALAGLADHQRIPALQALFGDRAVKSIGPLVLSLDRLRDAFGLVGAEANYADSVEKAFASSSKTTENTLLLLKNSFGVLAVSVGQLFLPALNAAAGALTWLVKGLIAVSRTEAGGFILQLAAGFAAAVVAVTGLVTVLALLKPVFLLMSASLAPVLGPLLAIAAVVTLLALAWKTNFGGIASTLTGFFSKVKLVGEGVLSIFGSLKDGRGELSAELAEKLEANGLMGLVTTVSRVIYRVMSFFEGFGEGIKTALGPAFATLGAAFDLVGEALKPLFTWLGKLAEKLGLAAGETNASGWATFGKVLGAIAAGPLKLFIYLISFAVSVVGALFTAIGWLGGQLMDQFSLAKDCVIRTVEGVKEAINALMDFDLMAAGQALINTFIEGIKAAAGKLIDTVGGVMSKVREFLPFSDAQTGPLSNLTASGRAFPATLAQGVTAGAPALYSATDKMLGGLDLAPPYIEASAAASRPLAATAPPYYEMPDRLPRPSFSRQDVPEGFSGRLDKGNKTVTIHIGHIELPGVGDAQGFVAALEAIASERA